MGYNGEFARRIILDIECAQMEGVEQYLEPGEAPGNYKNPDAIEKWKAEDLAKQAARASLDPDLCRIVAIGTVIEGASPMVLTCHNEDDERSLLSSFWFFREASHFIGFGCLNFDLPVLLRRSLYLGVKVPQIQIDKYKHPQVTDLLMVLSNNGQQKMRSLSFYAKRFGLPALEGDGADVPGWVAAGEWDKVESHLRADLVTTEALAKRLGVL